MGCPYAEEDDDAINAMAVRMANCSEISHQTALEERTTVEIRLLIVENESDIITYVR